MHSCTNSVHKRLQRLTQIILIGLGATSALALAGCSNSAPPPLDPSAGLTCVDDSAHCIRTRVASVKALSADRQRSWLRQRPTPKAYASGVRLFALRNNKGNLSCAELAHARKEASGAHAALRTPGAGLSPAQISRATMLAQEVRRDLTREYRRRCRKRG